MDYSPPEIKTREGYSVTHVDVKLKLGIHSRPSMAIVDECTRHNNRDIYFNSDRYRADGKSIMQLLALAAEQGTKLEMGVQGYDSIASEILGKLHYALSATEDDEFYERIK